METKYYYSYNAENNAFSGKYPAVKNPRRQNEYLLPYKATFKKPPDTETNEIAVWKGYDWETVSDLRGQTQINTDTRVISKIDYIGEVKPGFQIISDETAVDILNHPEKYKKINNRLEDISNTEEYERYLQKKEIEKREEEIKKELEELDIKRIRAVCEPSVKDEATGETWLDYYNKQVEILREEFQHLQGRNN